MVVGRITTRIARAVVTRCHSSLILRGRPINRPSIPISGNHFCSLPGSQNKVIAGQISLLHNSILSSSAFQRFGISSSASPQANEKSTSENGGPTTNKPDDAKENAKENDNGQGSGEEDLTVEDLVKLVTEKEELLKTKQEEIEKMKDKNFAKSLLDVADNLDRASSVVKESFAKIDTSEDSAGAVPLLKTLLEGVEMTEKQLAEFSKYQIPPSLLTLLQLCSRQDTHCMIELYALLKSG
ncbi:GrpE nucleotide exchange factor [Cynara cardunculus var. scolymus]|uniref:GrpE nucleotide exchange factor n=1 Tax=Cynara cardunculus var. scolymus TaxID=59895 RepID=A0A118K145_CYNCS|nr:GrpE nucleotide exchange factor [Cynara cardunculus var. scolymus]